MMDSSRPLPAGPLQGASHLHGQNPVSAARILTIGKRRWVAGMLWRSFEEKPSRPELRQEGDDLHADWATLRVGEDAIQAGFCAAVDGVPPEKGSQPAKGRKRPKRLFSLAASVADAQRQPWLGIYKIEEGLWWYIAVRDGQAILPDGDVIGGEAEIYAVRERHSGFGDWTYVEGNLEDLTALVEGIKPSPVFALRGAAGWMSPAAGLVVLAGAAVGGGLWWHDHQLAEQQAHRLAIARMRALLGQKEATKAAPSPLLTMPLPDAWLAACGNAIENVPVSLDGWTVGEVSCTGSTASIVWQRMPGATAAVHPEGALDAGGDKVFQSIPLELQNAVGTNNGQPLELEKSALFALLQGMGVKAAVQVQPQQPAGTLPGEKAAGKPSAPSIPQVQVHFTLPVSPFGMHWDAIPGFRISRVSMGNDGWIVEGVLIGR